MWDVKRNLPFFMGRPGHPPTLCIRITNVCLSTRLGMGRVTGNVAGFWIPKNTDENLGKNAKQQRGKKKNASAFVVKEDFLYCQTARAPVIPSNILRESGKIWKTLHKERRLKIKNNPPPPRILHLYLLSSHQHLFFLLCSGENQAHFLQPSNHGPQKMRYAGTNLGN